MGFVGYLEDIEDRYFEQLHNADAEASHGALLGPTDYQMFHRRKHRRQKVADAAEPPENAVERARRVIAEFWAYYHCQEELLAIPESRWERHHENVCRVLEILECAEAIDPSHPRAWRLLQGIRQELGDLLQQMGDYGPLSGSLMVKIKNISREVRQRANQVKQTLLRFDEAVCDLPTSKRVREEIQASLRQLDDIRNCFDRDCKDLIDRYRATTSQAGKAWDQFRQLYCRLAIDRNYRPTLQQIDRFDLNEDQERLVRGDYPRHRIQGASGSGKTVILIHRALRLANENPTEQVRLFTINRALAELLGTNIRAVNDGTIPTNLHVSAIYDFLIECLGLFQDVGGYRLAADESGERIKDSWHDFFHHKGRHVDQNIFADEEVRRLVDSLGRRQALQVDAAEYLRDEMIYIQSGYVRKTRHIYLKNARGQERRSRSIPLTAGQRELAVRILERWEEYLSFGHLCDIEGVTQGVAPYFLDEPNLHRIRQAFPTRCILVDEFQDLSTLELAILRRVVPHPGAMNSFFFAGDLNQKVYPKHHYATRAGFDFTGCATTLRRNYRNTRSILQAAWCIAQAYPPKSEEKVDITDPELSTHPGGRPVVLRIASADHVRRIQEIVGQRRQSRVAIVSECDELLASIQAHFKAEGIQTYELWRNADLDRCRQQEGDPLTAGVVLSRMEAVKGFEFDTVIAAHLSQDIIPRRGTPEEEYWRDAAIVYSALTRARDELIITYENEPSVFLTAMHDKVDMEEDLDSKTLAGLLGGLVDE